VSSHVLSSERHLTFKGNLRDTRYGWLRLTPAYSVNLVSDLISNAESGNARVLDPFCGTGTTALVCAEQGISCDTSDINPFLIWLTEAKTYAYEEQDLTQFEAAAASVTNAMMRGGAADWVPPLYQIEKWWDAEMLQALGHASAKISELSTSLSVKVIDLLQITFCRTLIENANVSFGHQSMSFKKKATTAPLPLISSERDQAGDSWSRNARTIAQAGETRILEEPGVVLCDARELTSTFQKDAYDLVVTSPPYPNRMSYIRELRPYMYWLGFLSEAKDAGELDWKAIGGTWGSATSKVAKWRPPSARHIPYASFASLLTQIADSSLLLSRYVEKYFYDMALHCKELYEVVAPGGEIHYIVGNSKFYDTLLPVEEIYATLFECVGFAGCDIRVIRKRNSKKELLEFDVSARKPAG